MKRRSLLHLSGGSALTALAGCIDAFAGEEEEIVSVEARLAGLRIGDVDIEDEEGVESTVASELDLNPIQVNTHADTGIVEIADEDADREKLVDALSDIGVEVTAQDIESAVTPSTKEETIKTLQIRFEYVDLDVETHVIDPDETEPNQIVIDVPEGDREEAVGLIKESGRVNVVLGSPGDSEEEPNMKDVLSEEDFAEIGDALPSDERFRPRVPVTLTEEAGERFVSQMVELGFIDEGRNGCSFESNDGNPDPDGFCIYTVVDGEITYGGGEGGLAEVIENGQFMDDPELFLNVGSAREARHLAAALESGPLPTEVESVD